MKKILEILFLCSLAIFFFVASSDRVFALNSTKNTMGFQFKNFPFTWWNGDQVFNKLSIQLDDNLFNNKIFLQAEFYNLQYEKIVYKGSFCMSVAFDGTVWDSDLKEIKKTNNVCVFDDGAVGMRYDFSFDVPIVQFSNTNMGTYSHGLYFEKKNVEWSYFQLLSLNFEVWNASNSITGSISSVAQMIIDMKNQSTQNKDDIINNQDKNSQNEIENANKNHEEAQETRKGILGTIKSVFTAIIELPGKIVNLLIEGLKSLFIPNNMDFINDFINSIEKKLGFIAEVPVSIIDFGLNLAQASWTEISSISFPSISVFGYNFWNSQEIDISEGINIFKPFKYVTDILLVVIMSRGLLKLWESFSGGGES